MAQHALTTHPLVLRQLVVLRVGDVTPRMRRITVGGPQLAAFSTPDGLPMPPFCSEAFDDHVKLVFAADGDIAAVLPVQRARSIDWPPAEHRQSRDYTPRRFDPVAGELDLDVVLHGAGPAQDWARTAAPGDLLHLAGPKSSVALPEDVDWLLLAGDETALPAIGRFLDERPVDVPVQVVVELGHHCGRQELALRDGDTLRWVGRGGLADGVRGTDWRPGRPYAWVAGESRALLPVRRWLKHERGLPASHVDVTGYWHAEPAVQAGPPLRDAAGLLDPLPWLATRAAVQLGVLDAVSGGARPVDEVAADAGVDPGAHRVLVDHLVTEGVLALADDVVSLGPVGEELVGDDHLREELFGRGHEARTLEALLHLSTGLRCGVPAWELVTGHPLAHDVHADGDLYRDLVEHADAFAFVAAGLLDLPAWAGARRVALTGPGSVVLARAARDSGRLPDTVVIAPPTALAVLAAEAGDLSVTFLAEGREARADVLVSTLETAVRTDEELVAHLRRAADRTDRLLLVDVLEPSGPTGASTEEALLTLAGTGAAPRSVGELEARAVEAGWRVLGRTSLGWDHEALDLGR